MRQHSLQMRDALALVVETLTVIVQPTVDTILKLESYTLPRRRCQLRYSLLMVIAFLVACAAPTPAATRFPFTIEVGPF